jgi:hypothetical protein
MEHVSTGQPPHKLAALATQHIFADGALRPVCHARRTTNLSTAAQPESLSPQAPSPVGASTRGSRSITAAATRGAPYCSVNHNSHETHD